MESLDSGFLNDSQENSLDPIAKEHLLSASKWARFLAIVGLVFVGLFVIVAFSASIFLGKLSESNPAFGNLPIGSSFFAIIYLIFAAIFFFPAWYLYKFATNAISFLTNSGSGSLSVSFQFLKSCFKFYGVFVIISLGFYGVVILFALLALAFK